MPAKPKRPAAKKAAPANALPPKEARSFPPLALWLSKPENVIRLKQILDDPVFIAACHYVESTVNVKQEDLVGAKAALDEVIVRKAALATGVRIFTQTLNHLPNFNQPQNVDVPQPWEHIVAPPR